MPSEHGRDRIHAQRKRRKERHVVLGSVWLPLVALVHHVPGPESVPPGREVPHGVVGDARHTWGQPKAETATRPTTRTAARDSTAAVGTARAFGSLHHRRTAVHNRRDSVGRRHSRCRAMITTVMSRATRSCELAVNRMLPTRKRIGATIAMRSERASKAIVTASKMRAPTGTRCSASGVVSGGQARSSVVPGAGRSRGRITDAFKHAPIGVGAATSPALPGRQGRIVRSPVTVAVHCTHAAIRRYLP